jgi:DNA-binding GntR family transcriptional regulator
MSPQQLSFAQRVTDFFRMLDLMNAPEKGPSAADAAYNGIIDLVLNNELRPGERTSVYLLAGRLDIGRTPVKEAITRLQNEGLLSVTGRSGTVVNTVDRGQAAQLLALRRALEEFAAETAVANVTDKDIRHLKKCLAKLGRPSSTSEFVRTNTEFHSLIVALAQNPFLVRAYAQLQIQMQVVTYLMERGVNPKEVATRQKEHVAIVAALESRDVKALKTALREHILTTDRAILSR